jgi:hypothetical protein
VNAMKKLFLVLLLLLPVQVLADPDGNGMQALCLDTGKGEPQADPAKYSACVQFLRNGDAISSASDEQLRQAWLKYVQKFPEELSWDAGTVSSNAFQDAGYGAVR